MYVCLTRQHFKMFWIYYLYECFVCKYVCAPCACHSAYGNQKRTLLPLELETIWMVVNHHIGARNRTQVIDKSTKCF